MDEQFLFQFIKSQVIDVIHVPYTEPFEHLCNEVAAESNEQKHRLYERLLELEQDRSAAGTGTTAELPRGDTPATRPNGMQTQVQTPSRIAQARTFSESLFDDQSVSAEQPWTTPQEAQLADEDEEKRNQLLADVANSYLGTMEQRVAYILQRFPETRDSDTALCIRYWKRFQADVLERW